jgi:flagellar protein FliS
MSFALARYHVVRIETASPGDVLIQLYDGAIRFLKDAIDAMNSNDMARKANALKKAHAIVSEFQATLDHDRAPELCGQLDSLYDYTLLQITQGTLHRDPKPLASAVTVLTNLRDGWAQAIENNK